MPLAALRAMIDAHISGQRGIATEFSSWSQSLLVVLELAISIAIPEDDVASTAIAVVDTRNLPPSVAAYHLPALYSAGACFSGEDVNDFEYLIHGVVGGPGYGCVALAALLPLFPELRNCGFDWGHEGRRLLFEGRVPWALMAEEVRAALNMALLFVRSKSSDDVGYNDLVFGVLAALLGLRCRGWADDDAALRRDAVLVLNVVRVVPSLAFVEDVRAMGRGDVCVKGYPEVRQSVLLLGEMARLARVIPRPSGLHWWDLWYT
jgi:hypothetical protein